VNVTLSSDLGLRQTGERQQCVLVVEDDPALQRMILDYFGENHICTLAACGRREMVQHLSITEVNLVILDLRLGREDGLDLLREIRSRSDVPVIIITGHRCDDIDRVVGLELGADDYVTKPFGMDELLARLRAALRHRLQQQGEKPVFHSGDLSVDVVRRIVTSRGQEVKLTPREYDLLRLLVSHAGKVLTHRFILREVWGTETDVQYLRIYIRALRQKIELEPERPQHILTEQGVGYRLRTQD
jgi:two-component system, OmpR family, KDP operon response regulator KdpE